MRTKSGVATWKNAVSAPEDVKCKFLTSAVLYCCYHHKGVDSHDERFHQEAESGRSEKFR